MTDIFFRQVALAVALSLCLVTLCGADDSDTASVEAKPQATEEAENEESTESANQDDGTPPPEEQPADEEHGDAGEGDEGSSEEGDDEPSAEDQAFLQDPFGYLQSDMQSATVDLKEGQTTPPATVTQPRILRRLDLLIEQLERSGGGAGQAGMQVNRPAEQSSLMRGPGGQNEMRAPRDDGRDWADLSPKERQKILQSRTDGFPAGYDAILADYFRRLARAEQAEAAGDAGDDDSTPDRSPTDDETGN